MNLPDYNFLPAPLWVITVLHLVTLMLHFAAMNFLVGGVIVILFGKFKNRWNDPTAQKFIKLFPIAMMATITLGIAPLLFLQLVYPRQAYAAAIVSGWFWLLIVVVAIIVYYFLYAASFSQDSSRRWIALYLSVALVGFVYISYVYSSTFSLAERPDLVKLIYTHTQSGFTLNPDVGSYILRWLHMILGAITVGGFFVGLLGMNNPQAYNVGKQFFLNGMIVTMLVGLGYLFTLDEILLSFMRSPAVWFLMVSIAMSLGALRFFFTRRFAVSGIMLLVSLLGMVTIRHYVRLLHLEGVYDPAAYAIKPQWSVFALFLNCFVIAIVAVWYMLRLNHHSIDAAHDRLES
ncbi:MAG: hypothetical protein HY537_05480 [Deltaproteobacteria bacterium]|nr:hypothetical protein [Deltaproteobacteria bacterium]